MSFGVIEPEDQDWTASDPVTQIGDIWQIGDHIIACGNTLSPDEVLGDVLDGLELAKACITDPPYYVPTAGHIRTTQKHAEFAMAEGEMDDQDFTEFLSRSITASLPCSLLRSLKFLVIFKPAYENPNKHWGSALIWAFPNIKKQKIPC